jgi:4'-phosphopantetheinyl transferase
MRKEVTYLTSVSVLHLNRNLIDCEYHHLLGHVAPEKRDRIEAFRYFEDRQRVLMGDILTRLSLSKVLSDCKSNLFHALHLGTGTPAFPAVVQPDSFIFEVGEYGKPFLLNEPGIHFNISHAGMYVVCAVSDTPVGIDVETTDHKGIMEVAKRYFAGDELHYVQSFQTAAAQQKAFATIWTMKESYIKRDGRGLSILTSFNVLASSNVFFYPIPSGTETVCHVCTQDKQAPITSLFTVDTLLFQNREH